MLSLFFLRLCGGYPELDKAMSALSPFSRVYGSFPGETLGVNRITNTHVSGFSNDYIPSRPLRSQFPVYTGVFRRL